MFPRLIENERPNHPALGNFAVGLFLGGFALGYLNRLLLRHDDLLEEGGSSVNKKNNVNAKDYFGRTALHLACSRGQLEVVKVLLEMGADVNIKTDLGALTPLHFACEDGFCLEVVRALIDNGADVNAKDRRAGRTPLHLASERGHLEVIKMLVENGAKVNAKDKFGQTPLFRVCVKGHLEAAKLLIENGADVNTKTNNDWTLLDWALYWTCQNSINLEVTKLLLENGADAGAKNSFGETVLHYALTNLHVAVQESHLKVVKLLIKNGADANAKDDAGRSPLHLTSKMHPSDIVYLLIRQFPWLVVDLSA